MTTLRRRAAVRTRTTEPKPVLTEAQRNAYIERAMRKGANPWDGLAKMVTTKSATPLGPPAPPRLGPPAPSNIRMDPARGRMTGTVEAVRFRPDAKLDPSQMQDRRRPPAATKVRKRRSG